MTNIDLHIRYCCYSSFLWSKLKELGFEERGSDFESKGLNRIRRFYKDTIDGVNFKNFLKVEDSYHGIILYKYDLDPSMQLKAPGYKTWIIKYNGMSINKELLEHFSKKGI